MYSFPKHRLCTYISVGTRQPVDRRGRVFSLTGLPVRHEPIPYRFAGRVGGLVESFSESPIYSDCTYLSLDSEESQFHLSTAQIATDKEEKIAHKTSKVQARIERATHA